jgi:putative ABC transport system substrate-binding protein
VPVQVDSDLGPAFDSIVRQQLEGLEVSGDPFHLSRAAQIVALAARYKVPAIYYSREYVTAGGLLSYGPVYTDTYRQIGVYAGRIVKGERPADLPVLQPTRFELVINLKTARALGLTVSNQMQLLADELDAIARRRAC